MLVTMLLELPLPGVGAVSGQRLQTQVGSLRWKLDDILVTGTVSSGTHCLSISCKSNVQVSAAGLPTDFLSAAWSQWSAGSPMNRLTDVMMLATRGSHPGFTATWSDIKNWAGGDTQLAIARISGTAKHSRIFNAIKTAGLGSDATLSDADVLRFVQAVVVQPYDFQLADSKDEAHAISQCREVLDPAHAGGAADLWKALVEACGEVRLGHGTVELADLWIRLRDVFYLRERPSLEAGWKVLKGLTDDSMTLVDVRARASSGWLVAHPDELAVVDTLVATSADELSAGAWTESNRSHRAGKQEAFFLAHAAVGMLTSTEHPGGNARDVALSVVASGDQAGSQALFEALYDRRSDVGNETWMRLTNLGILWAGLLGLYVRRDETGRERWGRWLDRFRRFSLVVVGEQELIRPKDLAIRVARLCERRVAREVPDPFFGRVARRRSRGLDDEALIATFRWLVGDEVKQLPQLFATISSHHILVMLLEFELWRRAREAEDDARDEDERRRTNRDEPPSSLGYAVLHASGRLLPELSTEQARDLWQPILSLGPNAHYFVRNFIEAFLFSLPSTSRLDVAAQQWRSMLEFALSAWRPHRGHYREQLLAVLLGCGRELILDQRPELCLVVEGMVDLFERWAKEYLGRSEDSVAWFCGLLSAKTWSGMRRVGLVWLHSALQSRTQGVRWSRDAAGSSLVSLLDVVLHQDAEGVRSDPLARDAFLFLTSLLVSRQVTAALALQDRALRAFAR